MPLPSELFARGAGQPGALLLRCTACGGELIHFAEERFLLCPASRLRFSITEDDIPVMLLDEATRLDEAEAAALLARAREQGPAVP